ncbi:hypothetical protein BGW37DRAFT_523643 [Umbelopsis sp. PMI_123]|nr:hypothetical protein BGW37DRAFT_523643 [Umbelopsis sp. PMI_123]
MSKVVKAVTWGTAIIGLGYGLMKFTVPNEDEMRNRLTPSLRREADKIKSDNAEKQHALAERIREAASSDKPIWDESSNKK